MKYVIASAIVIVPSVAIILLFEWLTRRSKRKEKGRGVAIVMINDDWEEY